MLKKIKKESEKWVIEQNFYGSKLFKIALFLHFCLYILTDRPTYKICIIDDYILKGCVLKNYIIHKKEKLNIWDNQTNIDKYNLNLFKFFFKWE